MDVVFSTALSGLTRAAGQAGKAAERIVQNGAAASNQIGSAGTTSAETPRAQPLTGGGSRLGGAGTIEALNQSPTQPGGAVGQTGLAGPLVDLSMAKHAYQASAKLLETADQMQKSLLKADA